MDKVHYDEMVENFHSRKNNLTGRTIYLFGHCEATLTLADLLLQNGIIPAGILDNSKIKHGQDYKGITVVEPAAVLAAPEDETVVLIVTRFYEAMNAQLRNMGFTAMS